MRERNNFDLIRLVAALQVLLLHMLADLKLTPGQGWLRQTVGVLAWFPGVPIFFVVSGFLITPSLERSPTLLEYARKRFLRIYPALWACFGVSLVLLAMFGFVTAATLGRLWFWKWVACQVTIGQSYNPPALRGFGVGAVNGSLWTIPVELGFYTGIALIYATFGLERRGRRVSTAILVAFAAASLLIYVASGTGTAPPSNGLQKAIYCSPFPHFWIWLLGALAYKNFDRVRPFVSGSFPLWLAAYLVVHRYGQVGPWFTYPILAGVVLSAAYTLPALSHRLLRGNDISYGIYVYHMLAVNAALQLGRSRTWTVVPWIFACVVAAALLSWWAIERPALKLKSVRIPARPAPSPIPVAAEGVLVPGPNQGA